MRDTLVWLPRKNSGQGKQLIKDQHIIALGYTPHHPCCALPCVGGSAKKGEAATAVTMASVQPGHGSVRSHGASADPAAISAQPPSASAASPAPDTLPGYGGMGVVQRLRRSSSRRASGSGAALPCECRCVAHLVQGLVAFGNLGSALILCGADYSLVFLSLSNTCSSSTSLALFLDQLLYPPSSHLTSSHRRTECVHAATLCR